MRTAVLTVFYPGMQPFIDAYIQCINSQSDQGFEMVIVDDAYPGPISLVKERIQVPCHGRRERHPSRSVYSDIAKTFNSYPWIVSNPIQHYTGTRPMANE